MEESSGVPLTPAGELIRHDRWTTRTEDEFDAAFGSLFFEGPDAKDRLYRFASLIVLSASIAGFGLLADSAGVVIGAMLVAPLMTPIQALGAGLVHGSPRRIGASTLVIAGGLLGAVATGYLVSMIGSGGVVVDALPHEILARTAPGLLDLCIAVAAGAAGGYVIARPAVSSALPGVGIAVALVPPLAVVGICLELGEPKLARGALLLFLTNFAAIVLASAIMIFAAGFRPRTSASRHTRVGFLVALGVVIAVAVPLAVHTRDVLADSHAARTVDATLPLWDPLVRPVSLHVDDRSSHVVVSLVLTSSRTPVSVWELARLLRERLDKPVEVELRVQSEVIDRAVAG